MKQKILIVVSTSLLIAFVLSGVTNLRHTKHKIQLQNIQLQDRTADLKDLDIRYKNLNIELNKAEDLNKQEIDKLEVEKNKLKEEKARLERELQARVDAKEAQRVALASLPEKVLNTLTATETASAAPLRSSGTTGNCGDNMYKQYIYQHESGCNTDRYNSIGCYGIGQSCPKSKIDHCGADFACQDSWFSGYAVSRYGSWEGAYNFWLTNHWW